MLLWDVLSFCSLLVRFVISDHISGTDISIMTYALVYELVVLKIWIWTLNPVWNARRCSSCRAINVSGSPEQGHMFYGLWHDCSLVRSRLSRTIPAETVM